MSNDARLRQVANEIAGKHRVVRDAREVDVKKWGMPDDTHLLRMPAAFRDDVVALFRQKGCQGDPMPATKAAELLRFRPSEVTIWGGYKESYKTTFVNELFCFWATKGIRVAVSSLEVPAAALLHKSITQTMANPDPTEAQIYRGLERLSEGMTIYDVTGRIPLRNLLAVMRYCAAELECRHFLLDNLTAVLSVDNDGAAVHQQFIADVCTIARTTGMHVHLIAHCRKPEAGDENRMPSGYDLRGTGSAADLADNIVMVWRNKKKEDLIERGEATAEIREAPDVVLKVDKQRHWDFRGLLRFWIDRRCLRFREFGNSECLPFS
jgi:twinkle protein